MDGIEPGWDLHRSFLAVLRQGSLSAAARALGLTQPTIGRHIQALEQAFGFALFTRSQHGLAPTDAALELRSFAETLEATAAALLRAASGQAGAGQGAEVRGSVRITASEIVGAEVLPAILADLRQAHPALVVELVLSNRTEDLLRRDADIAVRMHRPTQAALLIHPIGTVVLGLHAHPRYLDRCGHPASLDDLRAHSIIGFDQETAFTRSLPVPGRALHRGLFALRTDSDLAQLAAIRAGFGIGVCQLQLARAPVSLVRVLPDALSLELGIWLAMHEDLRTSRRCRVTFDALAAGLAAYVRAAPGEPEARQSRHLPRD